MVLHPIFRSPDPGTVIIRCGPPLRRICCGSYAKWSNEILCWAGVRSDHIKIEAGVGGRSGELRVLADFVFLLDSQTDVLYLIALFIEYLLNSGVIYL